MRPNFQPIETKSHRQDAGERRKHQSRKSTSSPVYELAERKIVHEQRCVEPGSGLDPVEGQWCFSDCVSSRESNKMDNIVSRQRTPHGHVVRSSRPQNMMDLVIGRHAGPDTGRQQEGIQRSSRDDDSRNSIPTFLTPQSSTDVSHVTLSYKTTSHSSAPSVPARDVSYDVQGIGRRIDDGMVTYPTWNIAYEEEAFEDGTPGLSLGSSIFMPDTYRTIAEQIHQKGRWY